MDAILFLIEWMQQHEAVLSGAAAALAISGIMSTWCIRIVQQSGIVNHRSLGSFAERIRELPLSEPKQTIQYCSTRDGSAIAYASSGSTRGLPIVRSLGWFTHLEAEWAFSQGRSLWAQMGKRHPLYRYDGRGIGLSPHASSISLTTPLEDLEAVMDAAEIDQAVLFGLSEGGLTAIQYAAKHPERVSHLILYGAFMTVDGFTPQSAERWATLMPLFRTAWGAEDPAARQLFTSLFLPDGNRAQNHYFNEMQRVSCDPETAWQYITTTTQRDARHLAPKLKVPTLVMHRQHDLCVPLEAGRQIAASIPNARLELLPGHNHWMLAMEDDTDQVLELVESFIRS